MSEMFSPDDPPKPKPAKRGRKPRATKAEATPEPVAPKDDAGEIRDIARMVAEVTPRRINPSHPRNGRYPVRKRSEERRERGHEWAKSDRWMPIYLKAYAEHGSHTRAQEAAGVSWKAIRNRVENDPEFRQAREDARLESIDRRADRLEEALLDMATGGDPDIRTNKDGEFVKVGSKRNVIAGIFILKALRNWYRDNYQADQNAGTAAIQLFRQVLINGAPSVPVAELPPTDPAARRAWLQSQLEILEAAPALPAPPAADAPDAKPAD